jgi:hypothetical protein
MGGVKESPATYNPLQETNRKTQKTMGRERMPSCYLAYELGKGEAKTKNPGGNAERRPRLDKGCNAIAASAWAVLGLYMFSQQADIKVTD